MKTLRHFALLSSLIVILNTFPISEGDLHSHEWKEYYYINGTANFVTKIKFKEQGDLETKEGAGTWNIRNFLLETR